MSLELSPEALARLNDKKWRRSQSKWMLWIYLTSSGLGVIGFARIAIKTKNKTAKNYTFILTGVLLVLFTLIGLDNPTEKVVDGETVSESGTLGTIGGFVIFFNYGLQIYLSLKLNKIWLVFKAQDSNPNWVQDNLTVKGVAQTLMNSPQDLVKDALGIDRGDYLSSTPEAAPQTTSKTPPPPPPPRKASNASVASEQKEATAQSSLNLNKASVEDFINVGGIDPVLAANIVVQREKINGFPSFESFATTMQLQPHQIAKLKSILLVEKAEGQPTEKPGRVLDI
jgi:DNA uptake protein ComE-like DNA-binding protein